MVEFLFILLPVLILIVLVVFFYYVPFFLWISARVSGVSISLIQLFPPSPLVPWPSSEPPSLPCT